MNDLLSTAQGYLAAGLSVMPANLSTKTPRLGRWKEFHERRPTAVELEQWSPFDAICIAGGPASGNFEAIDYDFSAELWPAWVAAVADDALIARLVIEQTQNGGRHACYQCAEPVEGNQKLCLRGITCEDEQPIKLGSKSYKPAKQADGTWVVVIGMIETRAHKGIILCAPTPGYTLLQGEFTRLPVLTAGERAKLLQAARSLNEWVPPVAAPKLPPSRSYPSAPSAIQPGDDWNARADVPALLKHHGWEFVSDDGINQKWRRPGKAEGHSATWCETRRTFYCFSSNANLPTDKGLSPFGLLSHLEHRGDCAQTARDLRARGFGGHDAVADVDLSGILGDHPAPEAPPVVLLEEPPAPDAADPGPLPIDLLNVPGFIGEVIEYNLATSLYPLPPLALAGALALMGTMAGRKVKDEMDNRTNVYLIGTAASGAGKDQARKVNRNILYYAGAGHMEGPEDIASDAGLISVVEAQPAVLFQLDEIGRFLKTLSNAAQNPHLFGIMSVLMKLYTSSNSIYKGKAYSQRGKERKRKGAEIEENHEILNPCVSVYGTGVPEDFYSAMTLENLENGSLARMMIFEGEAPASINRCKPQPIPASIHDQAMAWANLQVDSGDLGPCSTQTITATATPEATGRLEQCRDAAYAERGRGDRAGAAIWSRCAEKAYRLALIYACSQNSLALSAGSGSVCIDESAADWACRLAEWNTRRMIWLAERWVSSSQFEDWMKKFHRYMAEHGGKATQRDLCNRFGMRKRELLEVIDSMLTAGRIGSVEHLSHGSVRYTLSGIAAPQVSATVGELSVGVTDTYLTTP
jgi:hypothetical protein